jgi:nucleotide-binding universal stress UspA family protein
MSGEPTSELIAKEIDEHAARELAAWASQVREQTSLAVDTRTRVGYASAQILAALDADPTIDLVAMGCHGRKGLGRVLLGSVAEKVTRHARCAVVVAHQRR